MSLTSVPGSTATTASPPATSTISTNNGGGGGGNSGGLTGGTYLYTFLVTLALLLGVSGCIFARSFVLRRRRRVQIAAMLDADPSLLPPGWHGGRFFAFPIKDDLPILREKPVMWEVHVPPFAGPGATTVSRPVSMSDDEVGAKRVMDVWEGIMPLTTMKSGTSSKMSSPSSIAAIASSGPSRPRGRLGEYLFPRAPRTSATASRPSAAASSASASGSPPARTATTSTGPAASGSSGSAVHPGEYGVAVMIAMPDVWRGNRKPTDEDAPPPYVEMGLARTRTKTAGAAREDTAAAVAS